MEMCTVLRGVPLEILSLFLFLYQVDKVLYMWIEKVEGLDVFLHIFNLWKVS